MAAALQPAMVEKVDRSELGTYESLGDRRILPLLALE